MEVQCSGRNVYVVSKTAENRGHAKDTDHQGWCDLVFAPRKRGCACLWRAVPGHGQDQRPWRVLSEWSAGLPVQASGSYDSSLAVTHSLLMGSPPPRSPS